MPHTKNHNIETDLDVLVIGGGISGLATAWQLAQYGLAVQVWERSGRPGGKIKTDHSNGFQTEQAASMVMNFKPEVDQFFQQSGLDNYKAKRLLDSKSKRYLLNQGELQALPMTIKGVFNSPLWSKAGKFRLLLEPFIGRSHNANETVTEFITRRLGKEFLEKAMEPFVSGTLASDPDLACARYVLPRLTELEQRFGSITLGIFAHKIMGKRTARNPQSFSFKGGIETLTQHLADDPNIGFQANMDVQQLIQHKPHHWEVTARSAVGDITRSAKHVVLSCPADSAAKLLKPNHVELSQLLAQIKYAPLSVVHLGFKREAIQHPLDSVGFLVPRTEKMAINGNLWMSSIFSGTAPDDSMLLSSYLGGSRQPALATNLSNEQSIERVLNDLIPLLGICDNPTMTKVDRHTKALPLYHDQYYQVIDQLKQIMPTLPGLHLEANYKEGVSIRDRIVAAQQAAKRISSQLATEHKAISNEIYHQSMIEKPA